MLTEVDFLRIYALLDEGMVEADCGGPCGAFCCTSAAVKYVLPGEAPLFLRHHPDVILEEKPWYTQVRQTTCCCRREHRLFVCRAFPFRPVLSATTGAIIDLEKVQQRAFAPCWIETSLPDWRRRAIEAWTSILADGDNRVFYGRVVYLRQFIAGLGEAFEQIPEAAVERTLQAAVDAVDVEELAALYKDFFTVVP